MTHLAVLLALLQNVICHTYNSGCRCILLQTSVITAVTGANFIVIDTCMSNLSAGTVITCDDFAVDDDAAANTSSKCYQDHVLRTLCSTLPCLTKSCDIGIIGCLCRKTCKCA